MLRENHILCLPNADACPRTTVWDATARQCIAEAACEPGSVRARPLGSRGGACERLVSRGPGGEALVDVGRWTRIMVGDDGGQGSRRLCGAFQARPWDFDLGTGGERTVALSVELVFPDNDVTQVILRSRTLDALGGAALAGQASRAVEEALESLLVPLRSLGGSADAASTSLRVQCPIRGGAMPLTLPWEAGPAAPHH